MPTQQEVQVDVDVWKSAIQSEIDNIKNKQEEDHKRIDQLERKTDIHEHDIKDIKETLRDIKDDTKWLRRSITNALIVALIGGAVAIFYAAIKIGG
ncbi:hemolysin XhlA family protein [Niallia sp. FSL W8-1348]|uniref:hemolysin XhlA family protein n=1 Tax=Niallia sp. FSL W8-1348 TaxID=2954656 RepID=UPI0030F5A9C3